ncbi:hypothetical protein LTR27_001890 [Elasticomyces elasticus]|nr:hypothetical protein LTR27_001890 [Elasticomyces elasticus]
MADIYRHGTGNVIYLGEETDQSTGVAEAVDYVHREGASVVGDLRASDYAVMLEVHNLHLKALKDLFSRDWFSRSWIVQEVTVSKMNTVLLGSTSFSLEKVLSVGHTLASGIVGDLDGGPVSKYIDNVTRLTQLQTDCTSMYRPGPSDEHVAPEGMMSLAVYATRSQELSDPRDRIYSVLGLFHWSRNVIPPLLVPDYSKPVRNVHRDAARYLLTQPSLNLVTLQHIRHEEAASSTQTTTTDLPSWVPDWSRLDWRPSPSGLALISRFAAHGGTRVSVLPASDPADDPDVLELLGLPLDTITSAGEVFQPQDFVPGEDATKTIRLLCDIISYTGINPTAAHGMWQLARFLITGWAGLKWSRSETLERLSLYMTHILQTHRHPPELTHAPRKLAKATPLEQAAELQLSVAKAWTGSRLFATSKGGVGAVSFLAQAGDILVIFYGGQVPHVIRPVGLYSKYQRYICPAYVHGIMDGEAMCHHLAAGEPGYPFFLR